MARSNVIEIVKSSLNVTVLTLFIKLLGLIKQAVLASYCGATHETDAFFIASGVLMSLSLMLFSAISISLLSTHTKVLADKGREASNDLINLVLRYFLPIAAALSLLFFFGSPLFAKVFAPAYDASQIAILSKYIKMMSIIFVLSAYYLIVNVTLETDKIFVPGKMQAFFQNLFLIIAAVLLFKVRGIEALLWAFILSGLAECIVVTICARKRFKLLLRKCTTPVSEIKKLLDLSAPLIIGNALYEINDIVDKQISSSLGEGRVSFLTYGSTINDIVAGIIVGSVSTVLYAHFASWVASGETTEIKKGLNNTIKSLTIIILPIMAFCIIAGDDLLWVLFGRGNFGEHEVMNTYYVVIGYAVGFIFSSIRANLVKVFYAFQDMRTPLMNSVVSIAVNILLSLTLSRFIGVSGVALSTSLAMILSSVLLLRQMKKIMPDYTIREIYPEISKGVAAVLVASVLLFLVHRFMGNGVFLRLIVEGVVVVAVYFALLVLFKSSTLKQAVGLVHKTK